MKLKKTVFTVNVDNFAPEVTTITFPYIKAYAHKIGAEFFEITSRKHPDKPPAYEKFQIYDLGRIMKNDWNIFFDADTLIHPDFPDITTMIKKDTVCFHGKDFAPIRWRYDEPFLRDGRFIGGCNWFAVASDWCLDLWHPLDVPLEYAIDQIFPALLESKTGVNREHLLDDYLVSRNIARYGLKHVTAMDLLDPYGIKVGFIWHDYLCGPEEKAVKMKDVLKKWGLKCPE